jgi:hypothetical protein
MLGRFALRNSLHVEFIQIELEAIFKLDAYARSSHHSRLVNSPNRILLVFVDQSKSTSRSLQVTRWWSESDT